LFSILSTTLSAQTVNYSLPEKISHKNYDYAILGKTTEGILIYKYNKFENIIVSYDESMSKKWERQAQLGNKGSAIQHISIHKNNLIVFFSYDKGNSTVVGGQFFTNKMEPKTKFVKFDSIYHEKWTTAIDWYVMHDEARNWYYMYYISSSNDQQTVIHGLLIDEFLKIRKVDDLVIPVAYGNIIDELIDNKGNVWFLTGKPTDYSNSGSKTWSAITVYQYPNGATAILKGVLLSTNSFNSLVAKINNVGNELVLAGLYSEKNSMDLTGYGLVKYNLANDSILVNRFEPFNEKQIKDLRMSMDVDINNFQITDLVLRFDGGVLMCFENSYSTVQTVEVPNYYSPSFPSIKTYTYLHYDDLFLTSLTNEGNLAWYNVLHKKQVSENDEGYYSSYGLIKGKDKIALIYNEEISDQTNLLAYLIKENGTITRGSVCNSKQKNVFLSPRKARQVSLYEMVIPSEYRGYLQFVKIDY